MSGKELKQFLIENSPGGNQTWFRDYWMKLGGCAAVTACDSCIYFAKEFGFTDLYPFDVHKLTKKEYIAFSKIIKPYLKPRFMGIDKIDIYIEGFTKYLWVIGEDRIKVAGITGDASYEDYEAVVRRQIDRDMPVPCLLLKTKNRKLKNYVWHWFLLMGYQETETDFLVKTVTYSNEVWFSLKDIWDTGHKKKGGLISFEKTEVPNK